MDDYYYYYYSIKELLHRCGLLFCDRGFEQLIPRACLPACLPHFNQPPWIRTNTLPRRKLPVHSHWCWGILRNNLLGQMSNILCFPSTDRPLKYLRFKMVMTVFPSHLGITLLFCFIFTQKTAVTLRVHFLHRSGFCFPSFFVFLLSELTGSTVCFVSPEGVRHYRLIGTVAQWWEHSPPTNVAQVRFPDSASYVAWVCCWFSSFLREVFLQVLRFSPLLKNQHL